MGCYCQLKRFFVHLLLEVVWAFKCWNSNKHIGKRSQMKISDESPPSLPEELASTMPPEMVMQLIQVSSAFLVTLNSYVASTREIDRRARRLRRSRMLLLMRLMQLREDKSQRLLAAPPPLPIPLPIPRIVKPPTVGNK